MGHLNAPPLQPRWRRAVLARLRRLAVLLLLAGAGVAIA